MMRSLSLGFVLAITLFAPRLLAEPGESVVKISAFSRYPEPTRPWEKAKPVEGFGSGFYLGGNRILTNAHVINYASEIYVQWAKKDDKFEAKLEAHSVDLDLAVLTVTDPTFFANRKPLAISNVLPLIKDEITVYGFPRGGDGLSITKGEVSRINAVAYGNEGQGLQIQTSAPVNRGNSGGPALVGGKVVGLVYSHLPTAQNIGYIIPSEEIEYFLGRIKAGKYQGKPRINAIIRHQTLENESLRRMLGIDRSVQGVLVTSADKQLQLRANDIIVKIGDQPIDNRGNIQLNKGPSVFFGYLVSKFARNDAVPITVRRDSKLLQLTLPVEYDDPYVVKRYQGDPLPYFIHGPMVFVPARSEDVTDFYARFNPNISQCLLGKRHNDFSRFPGEELVVISTQFRHRISNGYSDSSGRMVKKINGTPIKNLRHLVEIIRDAKGEFLQFELDDLFTSMVVFDRVEVQNATEQLLEDAGIAPNRRGSPDMMVVWRGKKQN